MSNFKYSLKCNYTGDPKEFINQLNILGYKGSIDYLLVIKNACIAINRGRDNKLNNYLRNGMYDFFRKEEDCFDRDFVFNIDNKWEYEAALAIAAIRDDVKPYIGEWVIGTYSGKLEAGKWAKIIEVEDRDHIYRGFNIDKVSTKDWQLNIDGYYCRKATPEEIIKYMKEKHEVPTLPEKWCIKAEEIFDLKDDSFREWYFNNVNHECSATFVQNIGYYFFPNYGASKVGPCIYNIEIQPGYTLITYKQWKQWYDYHNKIMEHLKKIHIHNIKSFSIKGPIDKHTDLMSFINSKKRYSYDKHNFYTGHNYRFYYNYHYLDDKVSYSETPTYNIISYEDWKTMYNKEAMKDKKIIGYRLEQNLPDVAAGVLFIYNTTRKKWVYNNEYEYDDSAIKNTDWFAPVYEHQITEKVLTIGSESIKVIVSKEGVKVENNLIGIQIIKLWYNRFVGVYEFTRIKGYGLTIHLQKVDNVRVIKFGCTWLSLNELKLIIDTYNELNN